MKGHKSIEKVVKIVNVYIDKYGRDGQIEQLEQILINKVSNFKELEYYVENVKEVNLKNLEDAANKTKNAELIYFFARDIKGVNIAKLEDTMVNTKNAKYIYYFARDI